MTHELKFIDHLFVILFQTIMIAVYPANVLPIGVRVKGESALTRVEWSYNPQVIKMIKFL